MLFRSDNDTKLNEGVSAATIREGALETAIPFTTTADRKGGVAGVNLTARFRVLCPDLDFVCLGAVIYGTMTSERRNY